MTENAPVLRSRTTTAVAPRAAEADAQLDVHMRRARAIAQAGDAVPKSYRGNQGAVLLAAEWAAQRDLDLLTAIQSVAFIDGKPVIDATMQRALAKRAGYRVKVTEATPDAATVEVWEDGELLGSATYTIDEAKAAGLLGKQNWQKNPKAMCVARATTQAMRWHAPDVMTGVFIEDEIEAPDAVAVLMDDGAGASDREEEEGTPSLTTPAPSQDDVIDAEIVEAPTVADVDGPCSAETRGKAKAAVDAAKGADRWKDVVPVLSTEGIKVNPQSWTERQARRVIELCEAGS